MFKTGGRDITYCFITHHRSVAW